MHVTKGGWLGQTFALAKFDDSFEGKKSRIRRSKEERKGMVENFIKRYQKLNNGDFPSLALTRKEVGGSFYTVREIVREIIQENRVLGPPKLPPGDQNMENLDSFLENHPLGSMSVDFDAHLVPPKDAKTLLKGYEYRSSKVLNTRSIHDHIVDGTLNRTERNKEVKDRGFKELPVERGQEEHKSDQEITENEGTEVGTSGISEVVLEKTHLTVNSEEFGKPENTELLMEGGIGGQKDVVGNQTQIHHIEEKTYSVDGELSEREVLDGDFKEMATADVKVMDTLPAEEKTLNGAIRTNSQNLDSKNSSISLQQSTLDDRTASSNKSRDPPGYNRQTKRANATLNRINLESWEAASKKSNGQETHRLVVFIKAFITAFVKFWSE